jgi:hypothetical protein
VANALTIKKRQDAGLSFIADSVGKPSVKASFAWRCGQRAAGHFRAVPGHEV